MLAICSSGCIEASSPLGAFCKQIISGHGLFPLMRLLPFAAQLPGVWEGGQCAEPTPVACTKVAPTALLPKRCGQHLPPPQAGGWSQGPLKAQEFEQSSISTTAPLGRNGRRKLGVVLSYVTSFLRGRGPGVSQPSPLGRGWGRGRWLSSLSPLPVLQTLADLCGRHCFPSAPAPRRLHPLGVGYQRGLLLSEYVKQVACWLPLQKTRLWALRWHLRARTKGERPGPPQCPPVPWLPAPHSPHFLLENLLWVRGQKGGGPDCPSTTGLLPA